MRKNISNKKIFAKSAFTLIEVLVVIVLISILIGLSIFGLSQARNNSNDNIRKVTLHQLSLFVENYYTQTHALPICPSTATQCTVDVLQTSDGSGLLTNFNGFNLSYAPDSSWAAYTYYTDNKTVFNLSVTLSNGNSSCGNKYFDGGLTTSQYINTLPSINYPTSTCWTQ